MLPETLVPTNEVFQIYLMINTLLYLCYHPYSSGKYRVRAIQAKSNFIKKVEKRQAKSVFLFKNLRISVFLSSNV